MENLELRRIACEMVGWDAIISKMRGATIDTDPDPEIGTLIRVRMPIPRAWGPPIYEDAMFLRVQCGTGRFFSLAVPPNMRTAREANAWTYGLTPEEYEPEVRT